MSFDPISAAFDIGGKIIDRLWPDPSQRDAAKLELVKMQQTGELAQLAAETDLMKGQLAINQEEAKNENLFVSGWRPFIGWVCGFAFLYTFIGQPFIIYIALLEGSKISPPNIDGWLLFNVLGGILGLGGMRTFEKWKGVNK